MYACSGDKLDLEFEAKGADPLSLSYLESWNGKSKNTTIQVSPGKRKVEISLPEELSAGGGASGKYSISLAAVADGNGCVRKLSGLAMDIEIDRQRVSPLHSFGLKDC